MATVLNLISRDNLGAGLLDRLGGETALDLAQAVAPDGTLMGVDLSAAMLAFAGRAAKGCE